MDRLVQAEQIVDQVLEDYRDVRLVTGSICTDQLRKRLVRELLDFAPAATEKTPSEQQCGNCRFWEQSSQDTRGVPCGPCHRSPPHIYEDDDFWFPIVRQLDWCGEWQPGIMDVAADKNQEA